MRVTKIIIATVFAVLAVLIIAVAVCGDNVGPIDNRSSTCSYTYTPPAVPPLVQQPQGPIPIKHAQPIIPVYAAPPAPADIGC